MDSSDDEPWSDSDLDHVNDNVTKLPVVWMKCFSTA